MFTNLKELIESMPTEQVCREYLAKQRWQDGKAVCPYCECEKCYTIYQGKKFKCSKCRKIFTVTVGTIFQCSNIPLTKWFLAIYLIGSHKKGISSYQVAKDCGVSQKSGWFMLHRIRELMRPKENVKLDNIVEADEVYIGGKVSNMHKSKRKLLRESGQTYDTKTMIMGLIERKGNLKLISIGKSNNVAALVPAIIKNVENDAVVITDNLGSYSTLDKTFAGHETVNHNEDEFVRDSVIHTNTIEGAFSHFKRSIFGIYHHVTPKHLSRYCDETAFRYNLREMKDASRFNLALQNAEGRLSYKNLVQEYKPLLAPEFNIYNEALKGRQRTIIQLLYGKEVATFKSVKEAARITGLNTSHIRRVLKGIKRTTGGFGWKYA